VRHAADEVHQLITFVKMTSGTAAEHQPILEDMTDPSTSNYSRFTSEHDAGRDEFAVPILEATDENHSPTNESYFTWLFPSSLAPSLINFLCMSILFSANHGVVVSCISLGTSQFGALGASQTGVLYISYTLSGLCFGATYFSSLLGSRNAMILGMSLYGIYVLSIWFVSTSLVLGPIAKIVAYGGAALGGFGAGFLWTAQGSYFSSAAADYANYLKQQRRGQALTEGDYSDSALPTATSLLAGYFAFIYLFEEVVLKAMASLISSWRAVFTVYALVAVVSTVLMFTIRDYDQQETTVNTEATSATVSTNHRPWYYTATAAVRILYSDPKMKYMIGFNALFGFTSAFLNSYVNGEVIRVVSGDTHSVGVWTAYLSLVAALASLLLSGVAAKTGKGPVLLLGTFSFAMVAKPFIVHPDLQAWRWFMLLLVFTCHGIGRATFESTLKSLFADYFSVQDKEGAFANIILQNGLATAIGYFLTFRLHCTAPSDQSNDPYCVQYHDGTYHNVLKFEQLILCTALVATMGYLRAESIHRSQQASDASSIGRGDDSLQENGLVET
jgi:Major Facilitator Superfamily